MKHDVLIVIDKLSKKYNEKIIELGKKYYVCQWSWNPMYDGRRVYTEIIRFVQNIDGLNIYTTGTSYRYYFAWDIFENEDDAINMCNLQNSYTYDWMRYLPNIDTSKILNILK